MTIPERPTVFQIAYDFPPSPEIGSRRAVAFARALQKCGFNTVVFTAFRSAERAPTNSTDACIKVVHVREGSRPLLTAAVWIKQTLGRLLSAGRVKKSDPSLSDARSEAPTPTASRLLRALMFIDMHKAWALRTVFAVLRQSRHRMPSVVIATAPPMSSLCAARTIGAILKIPVILDFRDPWPEVDHLGDTLHGPLAWMSTRIRDLTLNGTTAVTCTSPSLFNAIKDLRAGRMASKVHLVMNGIDGPVTEQPTGTDGCLRILYAGALYMNRDPFPLIDAVGTLIERGADMNRIQVRFLTDNFSFKGRSIPQYLRGHPAEGAFEIRRLVSQDAMPEHIAWATVLLNLAQGQPKQIPAKTFEHLASGRENLVIAEDGSDTASVVDQVEGVIRVPPDNQELLASAIHGLYQRHVVSEILLAPQPKNVAAFSRETQTNKLTDIVRKVLELPDEFSR